MPLLHACVCCVNVYALHVNAYMCVCCVNVYALHVNAYMCVCVCIDVCV